MADGFFSLGLAFDFGFAFGFGLAFAVGFFRLSTEDARPLVALPFCCLLVLPVFITTIILRIPIGKLLLFFTPSKIKDIRAQKKAASWLGDCHVYRSDTDR